MRYAPSNCAKFSLFSALSQSRNPAVVCQMAAIKTKGQILVVPKTCAYMWGIAV